jgi:hypothetical protein
MAHFPSSPSSGCKERVVGRDNHPRERQQNKLARKSASRASYDRILIVSEGEKTEPLYFKDIKTFYKLHTANICILASAYGTTPQQVVDFARDECLKSKKQWEHVFCVFDRDDHPNFNNAIQSATALDKKYRNELKQPIRFTAIPSIPCFELWFLLHFQCVTREVHRDEVIRLVSQPECLQGYNKGQSGYFEQTRHLLNTAYANASRLAEERRRHGNENPFTAVDSLVKLLTNLKP